MAKKIEINENWEPVEVEDLDNLFIVIFKHGSFDSGYVEAFDTDDVLMQSAYDNLAKQYDDCGCDELTKIYLIKVPNTDQTVNMCNTGLFKGSSCDPHVIEATRDLFNRADCEHLSCWESCGLTEAKKKKNIIPGGYLTITTGDPALNMKHFNKCMGTDGLGDPADHPHLIIGDTLPSGPVAGESSGEASGDTSGSTSEGGAMGESLNEDIISNDDYNKVATILDELIAEKIKLEVEEDHRDHYGEYDGKTYEITLDEWNDSSKPNCITINASNIYYNDYSYGKTTKVKAKDLLIFADINISHLDLSKPVKEIKDQIIDEFCDNFEIEYTGDPIADEETRGEYIYRKEKEEGPNEGLNEDIEKELKIQDNENIEKDIEELEPPIDPEYFPNNMGINLSSIKKEKWVQQDDGQLKSVEVEFDPATEEEKDEQGVEEKLEEAGNLDYYDQLEKMGKLENRLNGDYDPKTSRDFNAKRATDAKLTLNRKVCIDNKLKKALKVVEDEMLKRGLIQQRYSWKIKINKDFVLDPAIIDIKNDAPYITSIKGDTKVLVNNSFNKVIEYLLVALFIDKDLATALKDEILKVFDISLDELKALLNKNIQNQQVINQIKLAAKNKIESLDEDVVYSHREGREFELPSQIKLLNKVEVENFITQVAPDEEFEVGYVTPVYFYKELDSLFTLVKATELKGFTGLDYRDASANKDDPDYADRVANAQRQIDTYTNGADGYKLNPEGERFSAAYKQTNKLTLNPVKSNSYVDKATGTKIDLSKILFYPEIGSHPRVNYFIDLKDGKGYRKVKRDDVVNVLYRKVKAMALAKDNNITPDQIKLIKKAGFKDLADFSSQYPGISIEMYLYATKIKHMDPKVYADKYPFSNRWNMDMFSDKVNKMIEQDSKTIEADALKAVKGMNQDLSDMEDKPQVRALYTNQVYYLKGKPGSFGQVLAEGLEEDVDLQEAKRYVKRYYVRPLNIFCGNKEDIIQALIRAGDQNCSVYSLKNLDNHEDVHLLQPSDIIYYWDEHVLYDKNHVQVMDYDLFVKHEEERKKVGNVDAMTDAAFGDMYDDRATEDDLKDKEVIANYKALNTIKR